MLAYARPFCCSTRRRSGGPRNHDEWLHPPNVKAARAIAGEEIVAQRAVGSAANLNHATHDRRQAHRIALDEVAYRRQRGQSKKLLYELQRSAVAMQAHGKTAPSGRRIAVLDPSLLMKPPHARQNATQYVRQF